jgi:hypothetical protein
MRANMIKFAVGFNGRCAAAGAIRPPDSRDGPPAGRDASAPDATLKKVSESKMLFILR